MKKLILLLLSFGIVLQALAMKRSVLEEPENLVQKIKHITKGFDNLPTEIKIQILKTIVLKLISECGFEIHEMLDGYFHGYKSMHKQIQAINYLKSISQEFKALIECLMNKNFILSIQNSNISKYQIAKALLNDENWQRFKEEYGPNADRAGTEIIQKLKDLASASRFGLDLLEYCKNPLNFEYANLDIRNKFNEPALLTLVKNYNYMVSEILIVAGANLDLQDANGDTILHMAIDFDNRSMWLLAKNLIHDGANVNIQNKHGYTPLICAIRKHRREIAQKLIKAGADITIVDKDNKTVLDHALENLGSSKE